MADQASVDWCRTLGAQKYDPYFNSETFKGHVECLLSSDDYPIETAH